MHESVSSLLICEEKALQVLRGFRSLPARGWIWEVFEVCELATPRAPLFTPLDHSPPSLVHSPGPHSSLLPPPLDCTPPSFFIPRTTFLPPGSLPGPHCSLLPPHPWFTPLGPHSSLLVHPPGPPLLPLRGSVVSAVLVPTP